MNKRMYKYKDVSTGRVAYYTSIKKLITAETPMRGGSPVGYYAVYYPLRKNGKYQSEKVEITEQTLK